MGRVVSTSLARKDVRARDRDRRNVTSSKQSTNAIVAPATPLRRAETVICFAGRYECLAKAKGFYFVPRDACLIPRG